MSKFFKLFLLILVIVPFYASAAALRPYYVEKINESENKITIRDDYGRFYLLTYSPECSSWWRYVGQRIYINARGQFLDGVGDEIYLGVGSRGCRISEVRGVKSGAGYYVVYSSSICPDRGYISPTDPNMCECSTGYKYDDERNLCVPFKSNDQICREKFGLYSIWDGTYDSKKALNCVCKEGYIWNQTKTACIKSTANTAVANSGVANVVATDAQNSDTTVNTNPENQNTQESNQNLSNQGSQKVAGTNTGKAPWYKTFWGFVIILVGIMLIMYSFAKSYKNKH